MEHDTTTERKCHDVYEAAMQHRVLSEHRAREALDKVYELGLGKAEAEVSHLLGENKSACAQKEMVTWSI